MDKTQHLESQCNITTNNKNNDSSDPKCSQVKENLTLLTTSQSSPHTDSHDEKYDISPENSNKKSTDTSPLSDVDRFLASGGGHRTQSVSIDTSTHYEEQKQQQQHPKMNKSISLQIIENTKPGSESNESQEAQNIMKNQGLAFTIDFNNGKSIDSQRHKNMLERFQNRHRRGVSLSKIDDDSNKSKVKSPSSAKLPRKNLSISSNTDTSVDQEESPAKPQIKLRDKTNQVKDTSKRHSWSPRSSVLDPPNSPLVQQTVQNKPKTPMTPSSSSSRRSNFQPKSQAMTMALENHNKLKSVEFIPCVEPPLQDIKHVHCEDEVSEAGTYTLDGDNYTEEQKEKMNIDKKESGGVAEFVVESGRKLNRPNNFEKDLEIIDLDEPQHTYSQPTSIISTRKNILEVSYCHDSASKPKVSYLEKLKSRVKNIGEKTFHRSSSRSPDCEKTKDLKSPDIGTFTSITTSGVLSIKPNLEINPNKIKRKNSLTKSQIDSSEFVQGISRIADKSSNTFTDVEKTQMSGYQLNVFSQKQEVQKPASGPVSRVGSGQISRQGSGQGSSNTSISTAATKDDWIQEWARNAREYSKHVKRPMTTPGQQQSHISAMSRSYNFENCNDNQIHFNFDHDEMSKSDYHKNNFEEFGDNLEKYYRTKNVNVLKKSPAAGLKSDQLKKINNLNNNSNHQSIERLSRTISPSHGRKILREFDLNENVKYNIKPCMSPSRIPSPINSMGRARGSSQSRNMYGSDTVSFSFFNQFYFYWKN